MLEGVARPQGVRKWFYKFKQGYELFRRTGRWHQLERTFDRSKDRYYEHIEDAETGRVIRHKNEPLSQHVPERVLRQRKWWRRLYRDLQDLIYRRR